VNCDGLPIHDESVKMEELVDNIQQHHITFLTETGTNALNRILQFLPRHVIIGKTNVQMFLITAMVARDMEWHFWQLQMLLSTYTLKNSGTDSDHQGNM